MDPTAIRYAERLADAGAVASIGSVGDSYDNAMAESVIGLDKTECVRHDGPFRGLDDLELATLSWVHWFNTNRLHSALPTPPPPNTNTTTTVESTPSSNRCRENTPSTEPGGVHPTIRPPQLSRIHEHRHQLGNLLNPARCAC